MKKIYMVCVNDGEYGYDLMVLAFSTKEKAEKFVRFANEGLSWEEYYIVEVPLDLPPDMWIKDECGASYVNPSEEHETKE